MQSSSTKHQRVATVSTPANDVKQRTPTATVSPRINDGKQPNSLVSATHAKSTTGATTTMNSKSTAKEWSASQMRFNKVLKEPEMFCEYAFYLLMTYSYDIPNFNDYFTSALKMKPMEKYLDIVKDFTTQFSESDAKSLKPHILAYRTSALKLLQGVPKYRLADDDNVSHGSGDSGDDDRPVTVNNSKNNVNSELTSNELGSNEHGSNRTKFKYDAPQTLPHDSKCPRSTNTTPSKTNKSKIQCSRCLFSELRNFFWEEPHIIELYSPLREIVSVSNAREYEGPAVDEDDDYHPLRIIMFVIYMDLFLAAFGLEDYVVV